MRDLLTILSLFILSIGFSQQAKLLHKRSFSRGINQNWVYVKTKNEPSSTPLKSYKQQNLPLKRTISSGIKNLVKVKVPEGIDPIVFCNELRKTIGIEYADPILQYELLSSTSDPLSPQQYYLNVIKAPEAWNITTGDDDITIGIIDSGLDIDHEDLVNNLWVNADDPVDGIDNDDNGFVDDYYGYDFADLDTDPNIEFDDHGMIVGGIAGASTNNGKGIAGVGYNTKVAALKGFRSSNGTGKGLFDAIIYAAENGFEVVNLSWGRMGQPLQSEQDIINYAALEKDMVLVAAAGNEGGKETEENKWYPASYEHVLSVGGSDQNDNKSSGSTFNYSVDLVAPGVSMYSTIKDDGYTNGGPGTSFASPQVAATAALVKDQFPDLSALQIMERIRATTDDIYDIGSNAIYDGKLGKGRLNTLRAVSESNVKSLRAANPMLTSRFGETVFFGDTVQVTATLLNYLTPINDPQIVISSPNNEFTVSQGLFSPGYMGTMDSNEISFEVILNENIAPETTIGIRLDYTGVGYTDFQYLDVTTSPDYANFGNENLSLTISGNGNLGLDEYGSNPAGRGLLYQFDTLMTYTGILLATSSSEVSDNIIANYSTIARGQDFSVQKNYKLLYHPGADNYGYSEFSDTNRPLVIEQSNIAWEGENLVLLRYRIVNNSAIAINNLTLGVFADWDLEDKNANYAAYNEVEDYAFVRDASGNLFAGIKVMGGNQSEYSVLDMGDFNGNSQDVNNVFEDTNKYDFLVNQNILSAGSEGLGNDVASINGVTIDQLDAFDETFVNVIYAVEESQAQLEATFNSATDRLNNFLLKPRVLETVFTCDGFEVAINPAKGEQYEFYEDPLTQNLIGTFESIDVTTSKDTSFYVKNVDQSYPSDVFEIQLRLLNEIADFHMSTDTLYLDHPTTNVVQFQDLSLDAISWSWDFDEGTSSSLQNPSLSFSQTGTYTISLTVENTQGCTDVVAKNLVVANRPNSPILADIVICSGEDVTLNDPTADLLKLYTFHDQLEPIASGVNPNVSTILADTTIYVSGVYGSFESEKVPVQIDVLEVEGKIGYHPDTTSSNHQMRFVAENIPLGYSISWEVDGVDMGSNESITLDASGLLTVDLEITNESNCIKNLSRTVEISTSPIAIQEDLISCGGKPVKLQPQNGDIFGFYKDPELMQLIKKGTQLTTSDYNKIYVVNLEDGLPGIPIEVNVTLEEIEMNVSYTSIPIGGKNQVNLSVISEDELSNHKWFVNGDLSETIVNPTLFLNNEAYEIVLQANALSGCTVSDTLHVDFTLPLALDTTNDLFVYPNPTSEFIFLKIYDKIREVQILSLEGKVISKEKNLKDKLDISFLAQGSYMIKMIYEDRTFIEKFIVE